MTTAPGTAAPGGTPFTLRASGSSAFTSTSSPGRTSPGRPGSSPGWSASPGILGAVPLADYSGRYFARDHGLQPVDWIASYGTAEPPETHLLWQFTDAMTIPGIPGTCDCSVFHGSIDDLAAHAYGGQPPSDWTEQMIMALPTLAQGDTDQPGAARLVHRVQLLVTGIGDWNNLGPATQLTADGSYGPKTAAGVKAVQGYFGLSQDGTCGQATWHHLVTGG
jgi:peptidoglycan hydrolase-like protein with peptidoglycan-binding domain